MQQSIGEKVRVQRVIRGFSQEYMAFMLEISQAAYSNLERNETEMTITRAFEIAEILEISPFELMPKPKFGSGINYHRFADMIRSLANRWRLGLGTRSFSPPIL
ncbi:helix-turn-helix domain-containing protein [Mucilaginibacter sp. UR6-1]|uniref:helix-turn-helix transcriptional regulator n=1 Tax=Mucilaginibacter sp. UR6-1 TaxID=1435643 RepID=UPI001E480233|nr:helix-turn-helix transcriptional regulator [Mucilaginibacter sp. UR6-1]MCC8407728.1 helix-turn-helix domain-containing protein [Mucilaginibacter sp. UR6-1]